MLRMASLKRSRSARVPKLNSISMALSHSSYLNTKPQTTDKSVQYLYPFLVLTSNKAVPLKHELA